MICADIKHCNTISWQNSSSQQTTSFSSAGIGALECLFSKCCLYVLGSGMLDLHTAQVNFSPAAAVFALSCLLFPCCFFSLASFSLALAWDCWACSPRAMLCSIWVALLQLWNCEVEPRGHSDAVDCVYTLHFSKVGLKVATFLFPW